MVFENLVSFLGEQIGTLFAGFTYLGCAWDIPGAGTTSAKAQR